MNCIEKAVWGRIPSYKWRTAALLFFVLGIFGASAEPARIQTLYAQLVGVYTLTKYTGHGDKPTGRLAYDTSGRMWIMLLPPDRQPLNNSSAPEEFRDTMRRVVAYYGTYKIDEPSGSVIHTVEEASNPAWVGENFRRWYYLNGPDLFISLNPDFDDPLVWRRLTDGPAGYPKNG